MVKTCLLLESGGEGNPFCFAELSCVGCQILPCWQCSVNIEGQVSAAHICAHSQVMVNGTAVIAWIYLLGFPIQAAC